MSVSKKSMSVSKKSLTFIVVGVIVVSFFVTLSMPDQVSGVEWSSHVTVASNENFSSISISKGENYFYILSWVYYAGPVKLFRSEDKGNNWSSGIDVFGMIPNQSHPGFCVFNEAGNDHILVASAPNYIAKSVDNGSTFTRLTDLPLPADTSYWRYMAIGTNASWTGSAPDSDIYVVGSRYIGIPYTGEFMVSFTKSTDNGSSWSTPVIVAGTEKESYYPRILSDGNTLYLIYSSLQNGIPGNIYLRTSSDWGNTWSNESLLMTKMDLGIFPFSFHNLGDERALIVALDLSSLPEQWNYTIGRYGYLDYSSLEFQEIGNISGPSWRIKGQSGVAGLLEVDDNFYLSWVRYDYSTSSIMFTNSRDSGLDFFLNEPPISIITGSESGYVHDIIEFSGDMSYDQDGEIVEYYWDFGDGNSSEGVEVTHSWEEIGNYTVALTVTDSNETSDTCYHNIMIFVSDSIDTDSDGLPDGWEYNNSYDMLDPADATLDIDNDGLTLLQEYLSGSDPQNPDTDGDGLPDGWEYENGNDMLNSSDANLDLDNDGLTSLQEYLNGSDPQNADTDGDGLPDGWEYENGNDMLNSSDANLDLDNDGLTSLQEYLNGSDPQNADTDGDGMNDGWENEYGYDALDSSDAAVDSDNDGLTSLQEYLNGTDPQNPDTDGDNLPDGWETEYGYDALDSSDTAIDSDNDGLTSIQEYLNGSNPLIRDTDGDQLSDGFEVIFSDTDPTNADTDNDGIGDGLEFIQDNGYNGNVNTLPSDWIGMTIEWANYTIYVRTNSSVLTCSFDKNISTIVIEVSGPDNTIGAIEFSIPKALCSESDITIRMDDQIISYTLTQNETHYTAYVEYNHSSHELTAYYGESMDDNSGILGSMSILLIIGVIALIAVASAATFILFRRRKRPIEPQ